MYALLRGWQIEFTKNNTTLLQKASRTPARKLFSTQLQSAHGGCIIIGNMVDLADMLELGLIIAVTVSFVYLVSHWNEVRCCITLLEAQIKAKGNH